MCFCNGLRQRVEPAIGLPLRGVWTPGRGITIRCGDTDYQALVFRNGHLRDHLAVSALDRVQERQYTVITRSVTKVILDMFLVKDQGDVHSEEEADRLVAMKCFVS